MPQLPPAGVSQSGKQIATTSEAKAVNYGASSKPTSKRPGPKGRRQEPLQNIEQFTRIETGGMTPNGVGPLRQDIVEAPVAATRRSETKLVSFESIDGLTYSFSRTGKTDTDKLGRAFQLLLFAMIEEAKGGSALRVFDAFKLKFTDHDQQVIYPIPEEVWRSLAAITSDEENSMIFEDEDDEEKWDEQSTFQALGESE
jgi:hypothetical protein